MKNLKAWMRIASVEEQEKLATAAGTSRAYLYALANSHKSYAREASPELARRLELAAIDINALNPRLPRLLRIDMNTSCLRCEYARKCLGDDIITESEFSIVSGEEQ